MTTIKDLLHDFAVEIKKETIAGMIKVDADDVRLTAHEDQLIDDKLDELMDKIKNTFF